MRDYAKANNVQLVRVLYYVSPLKGVPQPATQADRKNTVTARDYLVS